MNDHILSKILDKLRSLPREQWDGDLSRHDVEINGTKFSVFETQLSITDKENRTERFTNEDVRSLYDAISFHKASKETISRNDFLEKTLQTLGVTLR
jgi:hypothetical protein